LAMDRLMHIKVAQATRHAPVTMCGGTVRGTLCLFQGLQPMGPGFGGASTGEGVSGWHGVDPGETSNHTTLVVNRRGIGTQ
jgi:hypothetical protein